MIASRITPLSQPISRGYLNAPTRNTWAMWATARMTIAEVEHLVPAGEIDPDGIHTPGIFVKRLVHVANPVKHIEQRTTRKRAEAAAPAGAGEEV